MLLVITNLIGVSTLTILVGLMPLIMLVLIVLNWIDPLLVTGIYIVDNYVGKVLAKSAWIFAIYTLIAGLMAFVPISLKASLIIFLALQGIIFNKLAGNSKWIQTCCLVLLVLGLIPALIETLNLGVSWIQMIFPIKKEIIWFILSGALGLGLLSWAKTKIPTLKGKWLSWIVFATIAFVSYSLLSKPNLFDPTTGQGKFWVNTGTQEVFLYPTNTEDSIRYSPKTGLPLRKGTPVDAPIALKNSGGNPMTSVTEFFEKRYGKKFIPVDTVMLGSGMIDAPSKKGWVLYIILPGDGWSGIRYDQTGRIKFKEYSFLTEEVTSLQCREKDSWNERTQTFESGKWKISVPDGKDYYHQSYSGYFQKSRALRWKQLNEQPIYILAYLG